MAVYAVGDLQGCLDPLKRLLDKVAFDPASDRLWLTGDIVNRGPASLEALRFVRDMGELAVTVLGNHDLHLLAAAWTGARGDKKRDTIAPVLAAPDREELLDWLRRRPMLHHDAARDFTLVHAGLPPQWDLAEARSAANELEAMLRSDRLVEFLHQMYGNLPDRWSADLQGFDRLRYIVNAFTRMRFVRPDGSLDLVNKGPADRPRFGLVPWYLFPGRRSAGMQLVFGHWSLVGEIAADGVHSVDTGCVYGGQLTALRLDDLSRHRVDCGPGLHHKRPASKRNRSGECSMKLSLEGRRAVVCGASRGIGRAIATQLADMGADLVLVARDADALAAVAKKLPGGAERHAVRAVDFLDTAAVESAFSAIAAEGPVHVLVNNTGGPPAGTAFDARPEEYLEAFRQHLVAAQVATQALAPGMRKSGYGRIINIISTSVKEPIPGLGVSNTIRAAVAGWAKTVSRELASQSITVNNVLPGFTSTERLDYLFRQRAEKSGGEVEEIERTALAQVPAGRFARPEEIAWAVAFLASPQAAYISGINLPVDGGRMASL